MENRFLLMMRMRINGCVCEWGCEQELAIYHQPFS
jgi:hypothetical protein